MRLSWCSNSPTHFVSHVLIYLLLTHHTSMIISPRQCHHHHSCHPSPHHSFISVSKLVFFSNPFLHRHLAPPRTDFTAIRTCSRFLFLLFSVFFLVLVFIIILPFQFFSLSYFSFLYFQSFFEFCQLFCQFLHLTVFLFSVSHFIFLLNISVLFSLCARSN